MTIDHTFFQGKQETSLRTMAGKYLRYCQHKGLSQKTIKEYQRVIRLFTLWCEQRNIWEITQVTQKQIDIYHDYLAGKNQKTRGNILSTGSRHRYLHLVMAFFKWLFIKQLIAVNPTSKLVLSRVPPARAPLLSPGAIKRIIEAPDIKTPFGIRNRSILEILYNTGMRANELLSLTTGDIHPDSHTIVIKQRKGDPFRVVPISPVAMFYTSRYQNEVRSRWINKNIGTTILFITSNGKPLTYPTLINCIIKPAFKKTDRTIGGGVRLFRYSMAAHMLAGGASVEAVKVILGYKRRSTSQTDAYLNIDHLVNVHKKTHPSYHFKSTASEKPCTEITY